MSNNSSNGGIAGLGSAIVAAYLALQVLRNGTLGFTDFAIIGGICVLLLGGIGGGNKRSKKQQ